METINSMYTIKIQVENHYYLSKVASITFEPSDVMLNLMLTAYSDYFISPVSSILVFRGNKLIKKFGK